MKNVLNSTYQDWLDKANEDLAFAKITLEERPEFPSFVAFHSQQAAEKALKVSLIYRMHPEVLRSHNLRKLLVLCKEYEESFNQLEEACVILDRYYAPTRYPDALPGMTASGGFRKEEAKEAVELADSILSFVEKKIPE